MGVSAVISYMRKFYLTYPIPTRGKDKNGTATHWKTSDIPVMFKCYLASTGTYGNLFFFKCKMRYLFVRKEMNP